MARGSVIRRPHKNGKTASYAIKYRTPDGRQRLETIGPSKKAAERALAERMHELNSGRYADMPRMKFEELVDRWERQHVAVRLRPKSMASYQGVVRRYLQPVFGARQVRTIVTPEVHDLVAALLATGLSPATVNHALNVLKAIFNFGVASSLLGRNPAAGVRPLPIPDREMAILGPDEIPRLLNALDEEWWLLHALAVFTGLRRSELLGLQWRDIDWDGRRLHVVRAIVEGCLGPPKSSKRRAVDLGPRLQQALRVAYDEAVAVSDHDGFVFGRAGALPEYTNTMRKSFLRALDRAGLQPIRLHDLRHTYASLLIAQGANAKYIQVQMGHSSIQVTFDTYGHLFPDDRSVAASRLEDRIIGDRDIMAVKSRPPRPAVPLEELPGGWASKEQRDEAIERLWREGSNRLGGPMTQAEVSAAVGVTAREVSRVLKARGVETNGHGGRRDRPRRDVKGAYRARRKNHDS